MPRIFSPDELMAVTLAEYAAMSPADKTSYNVALAKLWADNYAAQTTAELNRDLQQVDATNRRGDLGA